jgi:hypothetical protein
MTTHNQPTEATSTIGEVPPSASTTDEARPTNIPPTRNGPSAAPTETTKSEPAVPTSAIDEGRRAEIHSSLSGSTPRPAEAQTARTESSVENTESAAAAADISRPAAETPVERSLFADDQLAGLRARWGDVQAGFVDDPKECVQKADGLVADVVEQLTVGFTQARSRLEQQWDRGEDASTEDLRVALTRYREFFERLLAV